MVVTTATKNAQTTITDILRLRMACVHRADSYVDEL